MKTSDDDVNESIVVSRISGRFPNSNNMREFEHNLYKKVDMIDEGESRWKHFLQLQKNSKRVYAKLVHTNSNNDGFKKEGSSFPSKVMQQQLMEEFFKESKIDPSLVNFVEAHSTGTKLGDPEEVAAIDEVFCKNKNRLKLLPIGSVKSNMGHAEASSGVASIAKILLTFENQKIPPNINFTRTREDVPAFAEGRMRVVTEIEDLDGLIDLFMNCLIHIQVLMKDTRMPILPSTIRKLVIDLQLHLFLDVLACPYSNIIRSLELEQSLVKSL